MLETVGESNYRQFSEEDEIIIKTTEHFPVLKLACRNTFLGIFLAWITMGFSIMFL